MRGLGCTAHRHTAVAPLESHHVWPLGYHGPDTKANRVLICCNAHSDVHYYLEHLLKHNGQRPDDWRTWGPVVRGIAMSGYAQVIAYAEQLAQQIETSSQR